MLRSQPPRRPLSPWPIGAAILGTFVALSMILKGGYTALQIMFITAVLIGLAATWSRAKTRPIQAANGEPATIHPVEQLRQSASQAAPERSLPPVVKAAEVAAYLDVDVADVISEIQAGRMPGNRIGAHWLIRRESLLVWLDGAHSVDRPT